MKKVILLLFMIPVLVSGQESLRQEEVEVNGLFMEMVQAHNQGQRLEASNKFSTALKSLLARDVRADVPFDSLKAYKVMLISSDKQVRIFTWDVLFEDQSHLYFGFIHAYNRKSKKYEVYELRDKSEGMRDPENAALDNTRWYGAWYYQIVEEKYGKKKYYMLMGWDGATATSDRRLIDVLHFDSRGFPKFGESILYDEFSKLKRRIIFEYKGGVYVSLRYDPDKDGIIFDHLSPANPGLVGQYDFYGPDFTYDMLKFEDGKWMYKKNVEVRNPKDNMDKHFISPR